MKSGSNPSLASAFRIKSKWALAVLATAFLSLSSAGYSQVPELFEDRVLISNISTPWGFTFINSDVVLFTEKQGKLHRYTISTNTRVEITGVPAVSQNGQGGLLDIALHPNFSTNGLVYLTYAVAATGGQTTALGRGVLVGNQLQNFTELFRALPIVNSGVHFGSRIVFDRDHFLYMSVGDRGSQDNAQNRNNHLGKVLRFNDDGTVPASNPLVGIPNTRPEIFTWGNRNIQGMAMNPATGEIYAHEHGPRGGDELNLIKPNTNYGWPAVSFGVNYDGSLVSPDTTRPGMTLPLTYWVPSIAPSGMTFIRTGQPDNEADILIGALAGTHIHWLKMKDGKRVSSTRSMNGYARFRDIRQAPDGKLYAMTETPNRFVLLRSSVPVTVSVQEDEAAPSAIILRGNYPNPFNPVTSIVFELTAPQSVTLEVFNAMGQSVATLADSQWLSAGTHERSYSGLTTPSGIYFVRISSESGSATSKMLLIK
jgi:glucose/arabinose dehydrogenase